MKNKHIGSLALWGLISCASAPKAPSKDPVAGGIATPQTVTRDPSPVDPRHIPSLKILGVSNGDLLESISAPLSLRFEVTNFPLDRDWQALVVSVNDLPGVKSFSASEPFVVKEGLKEGLNFVRAYLIRSWGETLKNPEAVAQVGFFVGKRVPSNKSYAMSTTQPTLLLQSPRGTFGGEGSKKIAFDFLVAGLPSSAAKKYRVHYTLNGETREVALNGNYSFQNLAPGNYTLGVELVEASGKPYKGALSKLQSTFRVER